jgi:hypothetical protein
LSPQLPGEREFKDGHAETQKKRDGHGEIVARLDEEFFNSGWRVDVSRATRERLGRKTMFGGCQTCYQPAW